MRKILSGTILLLATIALSTSCNQSISNHNDAPPFTIYRLDQAIYKSVQNGDFQATTNDSIMSLGADAITVMLNVGHPDDSAYIKYVSSEAIKMFTPKVENKFPNLESIEGDLGIINKNFNQKLPQVKLDKIYSFVSPYRQSIYICDSTLLIALNHYLGAEHEAYNGFEDYIKRNKDARFITYDIVEALISTNITFETNGNDDLLSKMLYEGSIIEAKMQLVPNASLEDALGYTAEELEWANNNEETIWQALVSKELLYTTAYFDIDRILSPAPNTSIIHKDAPGRLGRYIGYKIVNSYIKKHSETTLKDLFISDFYHSQQTLIDSGYEGK